LLHTFPRPKKEGGDGYPVAVSSLNPRGCWIGDADVRAGVPTEKLRAAQNTIDLPMRIAPLIAMQDLARAATLEGGRQRRARVAAGSTELFADFVAEAGRAISRLEFLPFTPIGKRAPQRNHVLAAIGTTAEAFQFLIEHR
jgi:hypothetical protein